MNDLLVTVGLICMIAGGYMMAPPLALIILGLILTIAGLTRIKGEQNGPH